MTKGPEFVPLQKGEKVWTGMPKKPIPPRLIERLSDFFAPLDFVEEAFIGQIYVLSQKVPPHLFVQVRLAKGSERLSELVPGVASIANELLPKDEPMDIGPMPASGPFAGMRRFYTKTTPSEAWE